jgi:hypothetical protein
MPRYRPSSLRGRADSRQVPEKLDHRHRILRGRNDVSESGPPNSETHARRLRDKANREVESTTYECELLIVNGMIYVTYVIALRFYRIPPRGHPSYRPISEGSCAFLGYWPVPHHHP